MGKGRENNLEFNLGGLGVLRPAGVRMERLKSALVELYSKKSSNEKTL